MNIFKDFKLKWWQAGLFKSAAISFGIILGVSFYDFFQPLMSLMWLVFIVSTIAIIYYWAKQK